ncbi:hypothetical protein LOC68_16925 [Blastopirellula sp. JC732]|uniref:Uncharacterized protein n=1 Tax=Blastopirellula sediminis TaxID=2894196 RepID=A0A9X1MMV5_9BACT|nr:hypothetical protein [Blastopirellula sediminis]MCC9606625.1 hypothetical protein [Blastopirellula sediminis]MCC9630078.1 hypothetical protein [Blastopirellula sediminis]
MNARSPSPPCFIYGLVAVTAIGLASWFGWKSGAQVPVSRETTFLTEPLLPDGRVNYALAVLLKRKELVTPENNAAIPFLQATWPCDMPPNQWNSICREMEFDMPDANGLRMPYHAECEQPFRQWIIDKMIAEDASNIPFTMRIRNLTMVAADAPWRDEQFPPLAAWVEEQSPHIDRLHEIRGKTSFYFPMVLMIDYPRIELASTRIPASQQLRIAAEALSIRAMYHVGHDQPEAAWRDASIIFELGRIHPEMPSLIELNASFTVFERAISVTHALLASGQCDAALLNEIETSLDEMAPFDLIADAVSNYERLVSLDTALRSGADSPSGEVDIPSVDSTALAVRLNKNFDRITEILSHSSTTQRHAALKEMYDELSSATGPRTLVGDLMSTVQFSAEGKRAADNATYVLLPSIMQLCIGESRANTSLQLLRVAIRLQRHRLQHGDYPPALHPAIDPQLTGDPFTDDSLRYHRFANGYLLYSLFENQTDDLHGERPEEPLSFMPPRQTTPNLDIYLATPTSNFKSQLEAELREMWP